MLSAPDINEKIYEISSNQETKNYSLPFPETCMKVCDKDIFGKNGRHHECAQLKIRWVEEKYINTYVNFCRNSVLTLIFYPFRLQSFFLTIRIVMG